MEDVYVKLAPNIRYIFESVALTINIQHKHPKDNTAKLIRTLTEIITYEIWTSRCKAYKEHIEPNLDRSLKTIKTNMTKILRAHFRHHKLNDTIDTFKNKFCINRAICTVYQDKLNIYLPP
jgi:hypothetical protein